MNYYLGIDGGGTSCRAKLINDKGAVLGECQSGAANLCLGSERVLPALEGCVTGVLSQAQLPLPQSPSQSPPQSPNGETCTIHVAAGMAGTETTEDISWFYDYFADFASVHLYADCHTACVGAFDGADGSLIIAGTGSVGWAIKGNNHCRIGGWGFETSDLYSGAWLGLEAIRHANHAYDGLCNSTLSHAVLGAFDNDSAHIITWALTATPADYAKYAPYVIDHARDGDALACTIMQQAGQGISKMALDLMSKSDTQHWCFVGGVSHAITPYLSPTAESKRMTAQGTALDGALRLAQSIN